MDRELAKKYLAYIEKYPPSQYAYVKNFIKDVLNTHPSFKSIKDTYLKRALP